MIPWSPHFTLTPAVARSLMQIEAARARVRAAHFSTFIEGNRLMMKIVRLSNYDELAAKKIK